MQDRQKMCPHGVVIGSYSNFKQCVQSKSSVRGGLPWILLPIIFSEFRRALLCYTRNTQNVIYSISNLESAKVQIKIHYQYYLEASI